jgi:hypothetical protein
MFEHNNTVTFGMPQAKEGQAHVSYASVTISSRGNIKFRPGEPITQTFGQVLPAVKFRFLMEKSRSQQDQVNGRLRQIHLYCPLASRAEENDYRTLRAHFACSY